MARGNGGFWADFRDFIARGNVVDLAVAVVIGGAFGKIIDSFVTDIITPVLLNPALQAANVDNLQSLSANGIRYGLFLAAILNFLVIAFSIFLVIRAFEKAKRRLVRQQPPEQEAAAPDPTVIQQQTADALNRLARALETRGL
ncbi:large conductance mechanosensitive channel protein MscL [Kovacikia minuta CCNUW1]|uniref:large conductance mechanosensitive channel protein MscL n=1 Tax=Kovacikia minuta TaxID=2931930 RepID=UPI001CCA2125|nr:large conductance mechanosensitive channel protein MscL [Kovacikia minuta]UBF26784.1 large conductance mechanosensitive channel protein MscL [Kovacikia minuta CCNUW1]